jgi:DNA-binding GntR family transcriptional regulator
LATHLPQRDAPADDGVESAETGQSRTLASRLRASIGDDIVRGVLGPGVALEEAELARRFNVSRTPVREAIRLLVASGLVEARPHRSAVVARPSEAQLLNMFEALRELEVVCAGLAAERISATERADLKRIHAELLPVVRSGDPQRYHEVNESFHAAIYHAAHNDYLERLTLETRARISPFSRAQFRALGRLAKSHAEHDMIVKAILSGNREQAAAAMRKHIESVYEAYASYQRG